MTARNVLVALFGIAVFGVVLWVGFGAINREEPVDPAAVAGGVADAFVEDLEAGDVEAMAEHVRFPPSSFTRLHEEWLTTLDPTELRIERGPLTVVDQIATGSLDWAVDLPGADTMTWTSELELQRERGVWLVVWEPTTLHPSLRANLDLEVTVDEVKRAPILGADGAVLREVGTRYELGIEPRRIVDGDAMIAAFAEHVPQGESSIRTLLARSDLRPTWYYPVVELSEAEFDAAWRELRSLPGLIRRPFEDDRVSPTTAFAQHLLGRYAEITAELLDAWGPPYEVGDFVGVSGLERAHQEELEGSARVTVRLVRDTGEIVDTLHTYQGDPSRPVETTLDLDVQTAIENALVGFEDREVAIVVVDAADGAIRGSASRPLNRFNRAWAGQYPPGSVFKVVTTLAALDEGWAIDDEVDCPASVRIGGLEIRNAGDAERGTLTLSEALAQSCNTTFASLADDIGWDPIDRWARRLGLASDDWDLPFDAFAGSWPEPADRAERAAAAIGQGRVLVSPLAIATMMAAIEGGDAHPPWFQGEAGARTSVNDTLLAFLREGMRAVVTDGTGRAADVDGVIVRGKTGTPSGSNGVQHGWFAGTIDGLGFAVLVADDGSGSRDAAPLAAQFIREYQALTATDLD